MQRSKLRAYRRALIPLLTLLLTAGLVGLTPIAAQASSTNAQLQIKGPGSVYTVADFGQHFVTLPGAAGSAISFAAKVINTGTTTAQFKLAAGGSTTGQTVAITVAGANATSLIESPDGYFTPAIAPGKSIAISIKVTLAKTNPPAYSVVYLDLYDSDYTTLIDEGVLADVLKAPSAATGPDQIFTKNGSGAYTGGPSNQVGTSGPALAVGGSTTFTAHIVNGGPSADVVDVSLADNCQNYLVTVKAPSGDVTSQVMGGTYSTPTLAAGGHLDLTIKVTYLGVRPIDPCDADTLQVYGDSENFPAPEAHQYLFANPAA
jgi:hypothetical protein